MGLASGPGAAGRCGILPVQGKDCARYRFHRVDRRAGTAGGSGGNVNGVRPVPAPGIRIPSGH